MSDGLFSPMLRDLLIFVCLTISILGFVFAAYAWSMMQDGQKKLALLCVICGLFRIFAGKI